MVVQGNCIVRLVSAENRVPFQEHRHKDGKVYVEIEPMAEYYIEVQIPCTGKKKQARYFVTFEVDGKPLGYHVHIPHGGEPYHAGIWTRKNCIEVQRALKFVDARFGSQCLSAGTNVGGIMGTVLVSFHEATFDGRVKTQDSEGADLKAAKVLSGEEKLAVRSGQGFHQENYQRNEYESRYRKGKLLEIIELNYCTALGLIHVGILPKPAAWDFARLRFPALTGNVDPRLANIKPTILQNGLQSHDGTFLSRGKKTELFDLTFLSDSDEEGDDEDYLDDVLKEDEYAAIAQDELNDLEDDLDQFFDADAANDIRKIRGFGRGFLFGDDDDDDGSEEESKTEIEQDKSDDIDGVNSKNGFDFSDRNGNCRIMEEHDVDEEYIIRIMPTCDVSPLK